jgi:imidazole glycerol-phosphate synthase subunit HisH
VTPSIAIVDYGVGNRRSVEKAVERAGGAASITADRDEILAADGAILPGVGAFGACMERLAASGLDAVVRERVEAGRPTLGVCVGMQLLFDASSEFGEHAGLGLLPGRVERLDAPGLRLPHIAWSTVRWARSSPILAELPDEAAFYHVHSFAPRPADPDDVLGRGEYGAPFVSAVQREHLFGAQFHPEKSSTHGLAFLRGFVEVAAGVPTA